MASSDENFSADETFKIETDARHLGERYGRSAGRRDGRTAAYSKAADLVRAEMEKPEPDFPALVALFRSRAAWTPPKVLRSRT